MTAPSHASDSSDEIAEIAALWVMRRDRGLSAEEQDELSQWLAADPRHGEALAVHRWGWDELDRLAGLQTSLDAPADPNLLAAPSRHRPLRRLRPLWFALPLAAAAAVVFAFVRSSAPPRDPAGSRALASMLPLAAPCERQNLEDGSLIELNRGAAVTTAFSAAERRVRLLRGEASFTVAKDPARPFVVEAHGTEVRALGTVFNVRLAGSALEVLVTEGKVKLGEDAQLSPQQLAVVHSGAAPEVATLSPAQVDARLAWRPRLLDFNDVSLPAIIAEFNRRNPVQLQLADPQLAQVRLSATFRSDNIEGFVRLMESDFGMRAESFGSHQIVLRSAR